ncbi:hypothetical protein [Microbulbifer taiwanensis]|uniref:DUF4234 domain-containing protein n=1 Tax=Microbulbifer taiwanensis TaxID=986746 RepID=A0ABW1YMM4_9GAMM|nr:hypothetical protein [Microbulbifer taiwanensis]
MLYLIVAASALWVYLDATKHRIGKTPEGGFLNASAGGLAIATMLLWVVALPLYLINRNKLKKKAEEHPVTVKARGVKAFLIGLIGFGFCAMVLYADYIARMEQMAQLQ